MLITCGKLCFNIEEKSSSHTLDYEDIQLDILFKASVPFMSTILIKLGVFN